MSDSSEQPKPSVSFVVPTLNSAATLAVYGWAAAGKALGRAAKPKSRERWQQQ